MLKRTASIALTTLVCSVLAGWALVTRAGAQEARQASAEITILVPAAAEIFFDGKPTTQKGTERVFVTPRLAVGGKYSYKIMAHWSDHGRPVEQTREVQVSGGARVRIVFRKAEPSGSLGEEEAFKLGTDAYIYGYSLVTMEMTRRVITNVATAKGGRAPMGQFVNMRQYPTAEYRDVTAPNADTLYSSAWLDVGKEPYVFSFPDAGDRYFLMPMLDAWTNVFQVPGKRTTGDKAQKYLISGPGWRGTVPEGLTEYKSPTSLVWIIGRVYCTGTAEDYKAVHEFQDQLSIVPLSAYGKEYTAPNGVVNSDIDMKTPVRDQVNALKAGEYFKLMAKLMKDNPPAHDDAAMVAKLSKLGIEPGQDFDISKLHPVVARGLERATKAGLEKIVAHFKTAGKITNGWVYAKPTGLYGTAYLQRAAITFFGLGANRMEDAVYPTLAVADDDKPCDGANRYTMTFPKGQLPPVNGFWSLTMYDKDYYFVANPLNRYTLSQRNQLKANHDGTVTLYLQNESPGKDKESNWLPAPKGEFNPMLRLYWPKEKAPSILDGTWSPPAVTRTPMSVAHKQG